MPARCAGSTRARCWPDFAGGTADAFTLFERFEGKLEKYGNLTRAAIELAKDWRTDRCLRRLEALLCVADAQSSFIISGNGDVIEPEQQSDGDRLRRPVRAGRRARPAREHRAGAPATIVEKALNIAADICIYTNRNHRHRGRLA